MKQTTEKLTHTIKKRITHAHVIQSLIASTYILIVFGVMNSFESGLAVTSIGASAFIVFSFPNAQSSQPRFLIGGYCIGVLTGLLCGEISAFFQGIFPFPSYIAACAIAVFLSMILMTVLDFEHPSAVATAMAVTTNSNPIVLGIVTLVCAVVLCVLKELLKKHLHNL